jgi:hypothetical protein
MQIYQIMRIFLKVNKNVGIRVGQVCNSYTTDLTEVYKFLKEVEEDIEVLVFEFPSMEPVTTASITIN